MKRTKTLIGGILGTATHIVFTGAMFFVLALILDIIFGLGGEMKEVPYLLIVACLLSILSIVFNFLTIFLFKTSKEKYKRRLWLPIATVVVNIAFSILFFIENNFQIFSIIISVVLLAASFLIIWDIVEEKKRIEAED